MKVAYYTHPHYLDTALPRIQALSRLVELHVILEVSPEGWRSCIFDQPPQHLRSGLIDADGLFEGAEWDCVRAYWRNVGSFRAVIHECPRSIHPSSWCTSHAAAKAIRDLRPDVLHVDDVSLRLAWAVLSVGRIPKVLTINDVSAHEGEQNWRTTLAYALTKRAASRFIVHSEHQRTLLSRTSAIREERITAIPIGVLDVYSSWLDSARLPHTPTVLFFGRMSPYKGLEVLFEAAPLIASHVPGVRIVVAGRPVPGYQLPPTPAMTGTSRIDLITEYIPNRQLAELFSEADVVVCPYTDATQSGVILTAYAFGKPVVATCVGGLPEYVREGRTGDLVPPRDPKALASHIVRVLNDPTMHGCAVEHEIEALRHGPLAWDAIARATVDVYDAVQRENAGG